LRLFGSNAGFTGSSKMRSCRKPSAVNFVSEWYFLPVNLGPFSPAPFHSERHERDPAGHGRNSHHEPSEMSGSIDVPVTLAANMPGFPATLCTSVQPASST
jgi:hypothetical protein